MYISLWVLIGVVIITAHEVAGSDPAMHGKICIHEIVPRPGFS